jgi:hypothetical protein
MKSQHYTGLIQAGVQHRLSPERWWYLRFLIASGTLSIWEIADSGWADTWPYVILSIVFLVQFIRPTWLGWWVAVLIWVWIGILECLYLRFALHRPEFSAGFIVLWGMGPLVLLYLVRPRSG